MNVEFSRRLKEERLRLGLDQDTMAEAGEIGISTYYNYDSGKRIPTVEFLEKTAVLGLDIYYIITGKRAFPDVPVFKEQREKELLDNFRESAEPEKDALVRLSFSSRYMQGDREKQRQIAAVADENTPKKKRPAKPKYTVDFGNAQIGQAIAGDIKKNKFKNTQK